MPAVAELSSGLKFYELSHPWGYNTPTWPGYEDVKIERITNHAKHGVMTQKIITVMHASTHVNAPIHLIPGGESVGHLAMDRFFGSGVILSVPKGKWEQVTPADLEKATPRIAPDDIVIINTGWHKKFSDSQEYFGHGPGLSKAAAEWLVAKQVKLVGVDTAAIDHPMATSLAAHRNGPQIASLPKQYRDATGRDPKTDFPEWNAAHRVLLAAGVPTIENVGGDVHEVSGRRATLHAYPWDWREGDGCVVRLVAIFDSVGKYRIESGSSAAG